ncbi:penicillin acylase family protein [Limobrevibacterium gyesilva]|uniref:Penicillin acylase family protein n=1 Tax=Limobrevibacterium gyesilva TaxID=2991712 RepID=A0AA41YKX9_9PROT|nr:penicillin acylase family protein [Limobrevibacterium gyesilva]MCW3475284.1 penicillin acylase family protein [Limobrevibacterium gyesilva]
MSLNESILLSALRGQQPVNDVCRAAGITPAEFAAERDAFLRRHAAPCDRRIAGGVGGKVEILRDRAGVPHVHAGTTTDLYFGLGVAMAEDRLWQMDRLRRRALGRQAEILGPAYAASDIAHLTVGIDQLAEREPAQMDQSTYEVVAAMVAGINRQIETLGAALPIEFRVLDYVPAPFTVSDIVAIARGLWWSLNGRIDRIAAAEAGRLLPTPELRALYRTPEASENLVLGAGALGCGRAVGTDDATGSNNWALAGARTGSGHAVLAGDPHQPFWVPSSWYEFALHGPEENAAGCGHPGLPGLWWGSNGTIAWSLTNNAASTRDLYREEIDPADPARYRDGDTWRRFAEREVEVPVRGEATRRQVIRSTVRGPVVNHMVTAIAAEGDPPLSLRWVGMEHLDDMRALVAIARARDWQGFRDALRDWSVAVFNFVYADAQGNVGYQMAGRVPVRGRITHGFRDAGNPADRWSGKIPFDGLPHAFNPARGYVASANQRIVGDDYPYPIYGAYSQGHRGVRIDEAFAAPGPAGKAASIALQNDVKNARAERTCPHILRLLEGDADPGVAAISAALSGWDHRYTLESPAATVFEAFMALWQRRVLAEHLPARLLDLASQQTGLAVALLEAPDMAYFPAGTQHAARAVARQVHADLRQRLGDDPQAWQWGQVHMAHWRHPVSNAATGEAFDIGPHPVDGGSHTVRNTGGELPPHGAGSGAEYRIVVDFSQPDSFLAVQNIGNSGVPGSPHYQDQFLPWIRGEYHVVHLRREDVERACEATTLIEPG